MKPSEIHADKNNRHNSRKGRERCDHRKDSPISKVLRLIDDGHCESTRRAADRWTIDAENASNASVKHQFKHSSRNACTRNVNNCPWAANRKAQWRQLCCIAGDMFEQNTLEPRQRQNASQSESRKESLAASHTSGAVTCNPQEARKPPRASGLRTQKRRLKRFYGGRVSGSIRKTP